MSDDFRPEDKDNADRWLAAELNRIWLLAERALRAMQTARRSSRLGRTADPEDEETLSKAIADVEAKLGALRKAAVIGRLADRLQLRPLETETLVAAVAPH